MAFTDSTLIQAAFKKLFGLAHTEVKDFPLGNEANPTQISIVASDVYGEAIPGTASANASRIACTNATDGQADSYLTVAQDLTVAPDGAGEGHAYLVTIPASHGLIGETNPLTGAAYALGDVVMSIIPKKFGSTWRPVLYDATKTEITPLSSQDWILDERGFVIIRDNSTAPAFLKCYVYVGTTVQDHIGNTSNPHSVTANQVLPSQTGNNGKYLKTDGSNTSWDTPSAGGLSDGDKGDITVSASGATWTIDAGVVTLAKMADMATASLIYRKTAGTGAPEVNSLATLKTDLGLTGTNSGDQTTIVGITGTKAQFDTAVTDGNFLYVGDITQYTDEMAQDAVGGMLSDAGDIDFTYTDATPDITASIKADSVTYAKMQNVSATDKLLGRSTAGSGDVEEIACTAAGRALLDDANAAAQIATLGLDADLATFALPASTTISAFGATLVDDANAAAAIATLGLDADLATFSVPASTTISAFGATLVDDANAAAVLATLSLDADLATFALPASTTISAFGATVVDDTSATAARTTLGANQHEKSITVLSPTNADDITMFFTNRAITVTEMRAVLNNGASTPSVTWTIRHSTDRNATGNEVVTSGTTTTSITSGSDVTSFNDATIPADSFVWLATTAKSGTVPELAITVVFTLD